MRFTLFSLLAILGGAVAERTAACTFYPDFNDATYYQVKLTDLGDGVQVATQAGSGFNYSEAAAVKVVAHYYTDVDGGAATAAGLGPVLGYNASLGNSSSLWSFNTPVTISGASLISNTSTNLIGRSFALYVDDVFVPNATCTIGVAQPASGTQEAKTTLSAANARAMGSTGSVLTARIYTSNNNAAENPYGSAWFEPANFTNGGSQMTGVKVTLQLRGLVANTVHSIHVHDFGMLGKASGLQTGGHWNPGLAP